MFITGEFQMMQSFLKVANTERVENPLQVLVSLLTLAPGGCWYESELSASSEQRSSTSEEPQSETAGAGSEEWCLWWRVDSDWE